jgi:hypothetical protein
MIWDWMSKLMFLWTLGFKLPGPATFGAGILIRVLILPLHP